MKTVITALAVGSLLLAGAAYGETKVDPTLRIVAEQRYDDDLLLRQDTNGPLNGQFMTKLSPHLGVEVKDEETKLNTWYALDAMYRETTGATRFDHRAHLDAKKLLSHTLTLDTDLNVYRVSDPTSLPRMGIARTLSPVLYGKGTGGVRIQASENWSFRPYLTAEGAKVYEAGTAPGFVLAPGLESWYRTTYRSSVGAEYRYQYLAMGPSAAHSNGVFGAYRYMLARFWTFTAKAGPVFYAQNGRDTQGVLPRVNLELTRDDGGPVQTGVVVGEDLVGASGFENALWAQFASVFGSVRVSRPLKLYGTASYYKNGAAPGPGPVAMLNPFVEGANGYAGEVGAEYQFNRFVMMQGAFTRIAQVGTVGAADLSRNIAAIRLVLTNVE